MDIKRFSSELKEGIYDSIRQRAKSKAQEVFGKNRNNREVSSLGRAARDAASSENATLVRVNKDKAEKLYQALEKAISNYTKINEKNLNSRKTDILKNQIKAYSDQIKRMLDKNPKE